VPCSFLLVLRSNPHTPRCLPPCGTGRAPCFS
jgi:hypothetical protein